MIFLSKSTPKPSANKEEKEAKEEEKTTPKESKPAENYTVPDNVSVVTMPRLSDTMTDGTVATWLKKVGDKVSEGDILAEIETDKATMEFESFNAGTLLYIGLNEGETALVDSLLAIIGEEGTAIDAVVKNFKSDTDTPNAESKTPVKEVAKPVANKTETVKTVTTTNVSANTTSSERIIASPLAKKLAPAKLANVI